MIEYPTMLEDIYLAWGAFLAFLLALGLRPFTKKREEEDERVLPPLPEEPL